MSENTNWSDYHARTQGQPPRETTVAAVNYLRRGHSFEGLKSLDFGCGAGRDSLYLAQLGMDVTAVDINTAGILAVSDIPQNIHVVRSSFDEFEFSEYEFITSQWSLSFNPPETFEAMFSRLLNSLEQGGLFSGNIFGLNDGWSADVQKTFLDESAIERLFLNTSAEIVQLQENEFDGVLADGRPKHWHYFDILAVKSERRPPLLY